VPRLSTWLVRASLVCLVAGGLLGAGLLAAPALIPGAAPVPAAGRTGLVPAHVELMLVGWLAQLAMGVAYWILPRAGGERPAAGLAAAGAGLLSAGVLAATVGAVARTPLAVAAGRGLEAGGALLFFLHVAIRLRRWRRLDRARRERLPTS